MKLHMIRAISSPSSSTTGWATLIFAIEFILVCGRTKGAARLDVQPELFPAEDFEHFVECSDTAAQNSKRVRFLRHQMLALMHARDHHHFRRTGVRQLRVAQARWNDPDHLPAADQSRIGEK